MNMIQPNQHIERLILILVFSMYFFPGIRVSENLILRFDDFVILGMLPLILIYNPVAMINKLSGSIIWSIAIIILSTGYGYMFLNVPFSTRDINEIIRFTKPLLFIVILSSCDSSFLLNRTLAFVAPLSWLLIGLGFLQYFNIGGLGVLQASFYAPANHVQNIIGSGRRIVLVGSDPNVGAAIVMMFFLLNFFKGLLYKNFQAIVLTFLLVIMILMTSSRTNFLALGGIVIIFVFTSKSIKVLPKLLMATLMIGLVGILIQEFKYIAVGFVMAFEGENTSVLHRFEKWIIAWNYFTQSPFIGWGLAKATMETTVDGEYFLLLRRFGVIGTMIICGSIYLMPFWKQKYKLKTRKQLLLESTVQYYTIVIFFVMITNSFFSGYQLFLPYVFLSVVLYKERLKDV